VELVGATGVLQEMLQRVRKLKSRWHYDAVHSRSYYGAIQNGIPLTPMVALRRHMSRRCTPGRCSGPARAG
jgi:hypothetical protein